MRGERYKMGIRVQGAFARVYRQCGFLLYNEACMDWKGVSSWRVDLDIVSCLRLGRAWLFDIT